MAIRTSACLPDGIGWRRTYFGNGAEIRGDRTPGRSDSPVRPRVGFRRRDPQDRLPGPASSTGTGSGIAGKPCRASSRIGCLSPLSPMYVLVPRRCFFIPHRWRGHRDRAADPQCPVRRTRQPLATGIHRRPGVLHERLAEAPPSALPPSCLVRQPVRSRDSARTMRGSASREPDPPSRRVPQESLRESSPARRPRFDRRDGRSVRSDESVDSCGSPVTRLSTRECGAGLGDHGPCPGFPQYAPFRVLQESLWI